MFGAGLQLQQVTPGVKNTGNANISGVFIAGQYTTKASGIAAGGADEVFGHGITITSNGQVNAFGQDLLQTGNGAGVLMGQACQLSAGTSVALGYACKAGNVGDLGTNKVAIGKDCNAGITSVAGQARFVAMGYAVTADGPSDQVALGSQITLKTGNIAQGESVALGSLWNANHVGHKRLALIGRGYLIPNGAALDNVTIVGWYDNATISYPIAIQSNTLIVGNGLQSIVQVGAYRIGQSTGTARIINDANSVFATTESTLLYSAISAARTATLPAANAVPAGYRVGLFDTSGSASAVNTITLTPVGADTIVGGTAAIITAYGLREIISDGVSKWLVINSR